MAASWYPVIDSLEIEIDVESPGYGTVSIMTVQVADRRHWERVYRGSEVGALLREVTALALTGVADAVLLPGWADSNVARALLPPLQAAVLLAVGGTDRCDRILDDPDDAPAPPPLCVRCDEGTYFTPGPTVSTYCAEYGHQPFGAYAQITWERALELHASRRRRADTARTDVSDSRRLASLG